ncbi:ABC1 family-domain-containing protein [Coniochaeta sp. 2T2.1]|nr:ABC1 family-domain-containing protein [Coniochaeta sp. 2T2.1]
MLRQSIARHTRHATAPATAIPPRPLSRSLLSSTRHALSRQPPTLRPQSRPFNQHSSGPYSPLVPPSPSSLGAPRPARTYPRLTRWSRRLIILSALLGGAYLLDRQIYASGIARSARTFGLGLVVAVDYKINFRAHPLPLIGAGEGGIPALHRRNAERLFNLLRDNGGLYLKIGQAIAMQSAVLPPEFQRMFARMFDDAPQDEWKDVEKVIREDFGGRGVEEVFGVSFAGEPGKGVMERTARASASVAQVHWARLADGREVAVKIQKPEIAKQIGWDLWAFKVVTRVYTAWFDLPLYSLVPFITERLMLETDFENEAKNSERMRELVGEEPSLRGRVYVPTVYKELSSRRVLTTEWIEGVRLWDKDAMTATWYGGHNKGSPGVHGSALAPAPDMDAIRRRIREDPSSLSQWLKPERTEWRGARGKGGLGVATKDVMTTMVDLFSAQIFKWGVVHCDPHPGNIFIRRLPGGKAEMVLIDHGLYVYMSPKFRREYGEFWKAMMTFDNATMTRITEEWGIKAADLFASATLMRPYEGGDGTFRRDVLGVGDDRQMTASERQFLMQKRMKQGIRDILAEEENFPKELIFIGRNMRIVQGNNQFLGSPVNRVKMMGNWASRSLFEARDLPLPDRLRNMWRHLLFKTVLLGTDVLFYFYKVRQWLGKGGGMEDEVEAHMAQMAKEFGVELQHDLFEG